MFPRISVETSVKEIFGVTRFLLNLEREGHDKDVLKSRYFNFWRSRYLFRTIPVQHSGDTRSLFGGIIQSANMHEPFDDVIRSLCSYAKPSNATRSASSSPAARTPLTDTTSTQYSMTMSRHFKIITKEVGRDNQSRPSL